jgi:hypothetical protein
VPFRLLKSAEHWFRHIKSDFKDENAPLFEMYYICLTAGLALNKKDTTGVLTSDTRELVDYYPGQFKEVGRLITALFLSKQIEALGIDMSERKSLHTEIHKLVEPLQPNQLSKYGQDEINRYSYGGFEALQEWFEDPPRQMETFLPLFKMLLDKEIQREKSTSSQ